MKSIEKLVYEKSDYYTYHPTAAGAKIYLYPISLGMFYYQAGYHLRRSTFNSFLLMYLYRGSCEVLISGNTVTVSPGSVILLDTFVPHEYGFPADSDVLWIHFDGLLARNYYDLIMESAGPVISLHDPVPAADKMQSILDTFRAGSVIRESMVSSRLTEVLQILLENPGMSAKKDSRAKIIEQSRTYISEHYAQPLSLEDLARQANMSPYYFSHIFSDETGMTPHQYLLATRMNAARFLLGTSQDLSIKVIAESCGFSTESSFCATFRKWNQMTPSEYRDRSAYSSASS